MRRTANLKINRPLCVLLLFLALLFLVGCRKEREDAAFSAETGTGENAKEVTTQEETVSDEPQHEEAVREEPVSEEPSSQEREAAYVPTGIPALYLHLDETKGSIAAMNGPVPGPECTGTADLIVPESYLLNGKTAQKSLTGLKLDYIRGRGNATWGAGKKPYKLKFLEKQSFFGMGENRHFVLLANYFDNTLIRNRLSFDIARALDMEYVPGGFPVDLIINEHYVGSYYLCEHLRVAKSRVAIDDLYEEDILAPTIWGGYFLCMYPQSDIPREKIFETASGIPFASLTPSFNPGDGGYNNSAQENYIRSYIRTVDEAVFSADGCSSDGRHYSELLDLQSAADYWWIEQISMNQDAYNSSSTYLYKKRFDSSGTGEGKLYFGPVWDMDASFGSAMLKDPEAFEGFSGASTPWIDALRKDPEFVQLLIARYELLRGILEEATQSGGWIDQYYEELLSSRDQDYDKWGTFRFPGVESGVSYSTHMEELKRWIIRRMDWISGNLDALALPAEVDKEN